MMKKLLLALCGAAIVLVLGFLADVFFFWGQTVAIRNVTQPETVGLESQQEHPSTLRFEVTGHLDGEATLSSRCSSDLLESCLSHDKVGPGDVHVSRTDDWYDKKTFFIYQPTGSVHTGNLKIRYDF